MRSLKGMLVMIVGQGLVGTVTEECAGPEGKPVVLVENIDTNSQAFRQTVLREDVRQVDFVEVDPWRGLAFKDTIHGYVGVATSRHTYLSGCDRVTLERLKEDGSIESSTFDRPQLVLADPDGLQDEAPTPAADDPGGPGGLPARSGSASQPRE